MTKLMNSLVSRRLKNTISKSKLNTYHTHFEMNQNMKMNKFEDNKK